MIGGSLSDVLGGRPSSAFVGRVEALTVLADAFELARTGTPAAVLVGGEAGIGKSRLVREFSTGLDARVLIGGCLDLGQDPPSYAPFTAALRMLVRDIGAAGVAELLPPAAVGELARLLPEFGTPSAETDGARGRLFETILVLVQRLAEASPLVVVLEDLHWADRSTRELLLFLTHNLSAARVLFVVTYRDPPHAHPLRTVLVDLARSAAVVRLELPRFTREEVASQAAGILGGPPEPGLLAAVFERSCGNPLFVEVLLSRDGNLDDPLAPELRDLLVVAVERLPEPAQRLLRIAAVGGNDVGHGLLREVSGLDEPALDEAVRPAVHEHVLIATDDGYAFRHALIREAVYDGLLLPGERVRLHRRYAESLEADPTLVPRGRAAVTLAHHWFAAGDAPRAFTASWRAAEQAGLMAAHTERLRMLERVLQLWSAVPDPVGQIGIARAVLLRQAVDTADESGELELGLELADCAVHAADPGRDPLGAALAYFCRARARYRLGRDGTTEDLHAAMRLAREGPEVADRARLLARLAARLWVEGDHARALALGEEALGLAERLGDRHGQALALNTLAGLWADQGDLESAGAGYGRVRDIATELGTPSLGVCADINESHVLEGVGRHEAAAERARAGLAWARETGLVRAFGARLVGNLAESLFSLGDWDESLAVIERAAELEPVPAFLAPLGAIRGEILLARGELDAAYAVVRDNKALQPGRYETAEDQFPQAGLEAGVLLARGNPEEAAAVIEGALDSWDPAQLPRYTWPLLVTGARAQVALAARARIRGCESDRTRAATMADKLRKYADTLACRAPVARAHQATFAAELAEPAAAGAAWESALEAWRRTAQPYPRALALLRRAEHAQAARDRTTATGALRECVELADRLGAAPLARQARALAKRSRIALRDRQGAGAEPADPLGLTPREHEVLRLLVAGESNRRIAERLYISDKTVGVHVSHILAKLGVGSRGAAAAVANRLGLYGDSADPGEP